MVSKEVTAQINWPRFWKRSLITYILWVLIFSLLDCWPQIKQTFAGQTPHWPQWWKEIAKLSRVTALPIIVLMFRFMEEYDRAKNLLKTRYAEKDWEELTRTRS